MTIRLEEPLFTFQVITDTHITTDPTHDYNIHCERALRDIAFIDPESKGIMHVGDLTDHGFPAEYEQFQNLLAELQEQLPPLYITTGNHDVGLGNWNERINRFMNETGNSTIYHDHWIEDHHFIFLGTEVGLAKFCTLSATQLAWLDERLQQNASELKPIFLFLHQPLQNTVAGSLIHQDWYGVTEDAELKAIIEKYPQIILFTGHTHWELGAPFTYYDHKPAMFNAASIAYLWTDEDEPKQGSQGYYVEVYSDHVLVRGRDFMNQQWLADVEYKVLYRKP